MEFVTQYWQYELGPDIKSVQVEPDELIFHISDNRVEENPFNAAFPYLMKIFANDIHLSLGNLVTINKLIDLLPNNKISVDEIHNCLNRYFSGEVKSLRTTRYISTKSQMDTSALPNQKLSKTLLHSLSEICSIDFDKLKALNDESRIYVILQDLEILSYGLITRSTDQWVEISIATNKLYRKEGHGFRLASLMLNQIKSSGKQLIYVCESENVASKKIAMKLGLHILGEEVLGYRKLSC